MVAVSSEGKLLAFPVGDVPEMPRGKGNKLYDIPGKKAAAREELMTGIAVVPPKGSLVIWAGEKQKTLEWGDLKAYRGQRAQRGAVLPRGWPRKVERLEAVVLPPAWRLAHHHFFRGVDEVALDVLHAELPQHRHGVGVLDALRDGLNAALLGRVDQAAHALLQLRVARQALHQGAVDLHEIERHRAR